MNQTLFGVGEGRKPFKASFIVPVDVLSVLLKKISLPKRTTIPIEEDVLFIVNPKEEVLHLFARDIAKGTYALEKANIQITKDWGNSNYLEFTVPIGKLKATVDLLNKDTMKFGLMTFDIERVEQGYPIKVSFISGASRFSFTKTPESEEYPTGNVEGELSVYDLIEGKQASNVQKLTLTKEQKSFLSPFFSKDVFKESLNHYNVSNGMVWASDSYILAYLPISNIGENIEEGVYNKDNFKKIEDETPKDLGALIASYKTFSSVPIDFEDLTRLVNTPAQIRYKRDGFLSSILRTIKIKPDLYVSFNEKHMKVILASLKRLGYHRKQLYLYYRNIGGKQSTSLFFISPTETASRLYEEPNCLMMAYVIEYKNEGDEFLTLDLVHGGVLTYTNAYTDEQSEDDTLRYTQRLMNDLQSVKAESLEGLGEVSYSKKMKDYEQRLERIEAKLEKVRGKEYEQGWQTQRRAKISRSWDILAQEKMRILSELYDFENTYTESLLADLNSITAESLEGLAGPVSFKDLDDKKLYDLYAQNGQLVLDAVDANTIRAEYDKYDGTIYETSTRLGAINTETYTETLLSDLESIGKQKEPWEMTKQEWTYEHFIVKPDYVVDKKFKGSANEMISNLNRTEFLNFGVTDSIISLLKENLKNIKEGKPPLLTKEEKEDLMWDKDHVTHKKVIQKALSEGKPVPAEVLADYPELMPKKQKEPWEMKQAEFRNAYYDEFIKQYGKQAWDNNYLSLIEEHKFQHKQLIQQALSEGKPVPVEVLADYPELMPKKQKEPWEMTFEEFSQILEKNKVNVGYKITHYNLPNLSACIVSGDFRKNVTYSVCYYDIINKTPDWSVAKSVQDETTNNKKEAFKKAYDYIIELAIKNGKTVYQETDFIPKPKSEGLETIDKKQFLGKGMTASLSVDAVKAGIWYIQYKPDTHFAYLSDNDLKAKFRRGYEKAKAEGFSLMQYKAGKYGNIYVFEKNGKILSKKYFEVLAEYPELRKGLGETNLTQYTETLLSDLGMIENSENNISTKKAAFMSVLNEKYFDLIVNKLKYFNEVLLKKLENKNWTKKLIYPSSSSYVLFDREYSKKELSQDLIKELNDFKDELAKIEIQVRKEDNVKKFEINPFYFGEEMEVVLGEKKTNQYGVVLHEFDNGGRSNNSFTQLWK